MSIDEHLAGEIPAYLNNTLPADRRETLEKALAESEELRTTLEFWRQARLYFDFLKEYEAKDHLSSDVLLRHVEGTITDNLLNESVRKHLDDCSECRAAVELLRETYGATVSPPTVRPLPLAYRLREYFTVPVMRRFAVGFALVLIAAFVIDYLTPREPEWRKLTASADSLAASRDLIGAQQMYHKALTAMEPEIAGHPLDAIHILDSLAVINERSGAPEHAEEFYRQSLALLEKYVPEQLERFPWLLNHLASLKREQGNFLQAELYFRQADAVREKLAEQHPSDPEASRYRKNLALLTLSPQVRYRSPIAPRLPGVILPDSMTHVAMTISFDQKAPDGIRFVPALMTPSRTILPVPDTLTVDSTGKTVHLTLSRRYFTEGTGTYRLEIREIGPTRKQGKEYEYRFTLKTTGHR